MFVLMVSVFVISCTDRGWDDVEDKDLIAHKDVKTSDSVIVKIKK